jgi:hypothetical protein
MLSTTQKGDIAETAIVAELTQLGHPVSVPLAGASRYDLIVDLPSGLTRVQVKHGRIDGDHVVASLKRTNPNHNEYNQSYYEADEIDVFAIHAPDIGRSFWLPFDEAPDSKVRIRYQGDPEIDHPATRWAETHAIESRLDEADRDPTERCI